MQEKNVLSHTQRALIGTKGIEGWFPNTNPSGLQSTKQTSYAGSSVGSSYRHVGQELCCAAKKYVNYHWPVFLSFLASLVSLQPHLAPASQVCAC